LSFCQAAISHVTNWLLKSDVVASIGRCLSGGGVNILRMLSLYIGDDPRGARHPEGHRASKQNRCLYRLPSGSFATIRVSFNSGEL